MELWERARQGDDEAFRQLAEEIWPRLYRLSFRYLGDAAEAEDVAQEALLKAWARLDEFRGESRFSTWVLAIGLNLARNQRRRRREILGSAHDEAAPTRPVPSAEEVALAAERLVELEQALRALPPLWRAALECVAVQDMTYEETARVLHVPVSTVRNWVHRARTRLRASGSGGGRDAAACVRPRGGLSDVRTNP